MDVGQGPNRGCSAKENRLSSTRLFEVNKNNCTTFDVINLNIFCVYLYVLGSVWYSAVNVLVLR
jgi:hypothetical protein